MPWSSLYFCHIPLSSSALIILCKSNSVPVLMLLLHLIAFLLDNVLILERGGSSMFERISLFRNHENVANLDFCKIRIILHCKDIVNARNRVCVYFCRLRWFPVRFVSVRKLKCASSQWLRDEPILMLWDWIGECFLKRIHSISLEEYSSASNLCYDLVHSFRNVSSKKTWL